jgi:hypothetical protein
MRTVLRHCPSCGDEREFEAPPCPDDHGIDCPDLACVTCGIALSFGLVTAQGRHAVVGTAA